MVLNTVFLLLSVKYLGLLSRLLNVVWKLVSFFMNELHMMFLIGILN